MRSKNKTSGTRYRNGTWYLCFNLVLVFGLTGATQNFGGRTKQAEPEPAPEYTFEEPLPEEEPAPVEELPAATEEPVVEEDPVVLEEPAGEEILLEEDEPAAEAALPEPVKSVAAEPLPTVPGPGSQATLTGVSSSTSAAPSFPETVWLEDELPALSSEDGSWLWDSSNPGSGNAAHGHPAGKGLHWHGYRLATPIPLPVNGLITQQVWLDPNDPPKGIALKLLLAGGEEAGVYWEGEEEVFKPQETEELWYYGPLPEFGKWSTLEVLAEDLGLEDKQVTGLRFVTYDGKALWDRTAIKEAPPLEDETPVLPEGPVEVRPTLSAGSQG